MLAKKPKEKWRREKEKRGEVLGEAGEGREPSGLGVLGTRGAGTKSAGSRNESKSRIIIQYVSPRIRMQLQKLLLIMKAIYQRL